MSPAAIEQINHSPYAPANIPAAGRAIEETLGLISLTVISACLCRRLYTVHSWRTIKLSQWLILAIYVDSYLFVFLTAIVARGIGINISLSICASAIDTCLACYMTTKVLIYLFLAERVRIVRGSRVARSKDRLWLFNFVGMILAYTVVVVLNFRFRFAYINIAGMCIIGMQDIAIIPLLSFDAVVNIYLTSLFLAPLRKLYSFRNTRNSALRKVALRSFVGSILTLTLSLTNLLVLCILRGEPGWICLICCNADITFSVVILQWATSTDVPQPSSPVAGGRYILQKPDSLTRKRRTRDEQLDDAISCSESQVVAVAHIQDVCPEAHLDPEDGRGVSSQVLVLKDIGNATIPSSPSAEDEMSHFERKSNMEEVEYRNGII